MDFATINLKMPRYANTGAIQIDTIKDYDIPSNPNKKTAMPMKNHFDFKNLMTFGLFLLALLTFVFTFCK